ncbi:hypothetical protein D3C75_1255030 [compost metagenome]
MERLRRIRMDIPAFPTALLGLHIDTVHVPDSPVDPGLAIAQTELTGAADAAVQ